MRYVHSLRIISLALLPVIASLTARGDDTIPGAFARPLHWRVGAEVSPAWVPGTNGYIRGENPFARPIDASVSGALRVDFSFDPSTRQGRLFPGLYQGVGVGLNSFIYNNVLGTPVSVYVYQGAPIARMGSRLWLGYEWEFGAAMGWKYNASQAIDNNAAVSTPVTAHMGLGLKLHYELSLRWQLTAGIDAGHFSNGNTHWPNAGVNTLGVSIGASYAINPPAGNPPAPTAGLQAEADRPRWMYDIMVYGSWRKRVVTVASGDPQLLPGRFGILGLQLSPLRKLNRWVAVGPALEVQWDESAALASYWVDGTFGDNIKFVRPSIGKQLSVGLSAQAELTMPIFSVNAGLGYDIVNPRGDKRFFQSLALKTFVTNRLYLNVGYRLGDFKEPQNLMLGLGLRL